MLTHLGVQRFALPAASETVETWRDGFGFQMMEPELLANYKREFKILIFPGTHVMFKEVQPPDKRKLYTPSACVRLKFVLDKNITSGADVVHLNIRVFGTWEDAGLKAPVTSPLDNVRDEDLRGDDDGWEGCMPTESKKDLRSCATHEVVGVATNLPVQVTQMVQPPREGIESHHELNTRGTFTAPPDVKKGETATNATLASGKGKVALFADGQLKGEVTGFSSKIDVGDAEGGNGEGAPNATAQLGDEIGRPSAHDPGSTPTKKTWEEHAASLPPGTAIHPDFLKLCSGLDSPTTT